MTEWQFFKNELKNIFRTKQTILVPLSSYTNNDARIEHVVVLMLENRTYESIMGAMPENIAVDEKNHFNVDWYGRKFYQRPLKSADHSIRMDPPHELENFLEALKENNAGFVREFQQRYPDATDEDLQFIMSYYPWKSLPAFHTLAELFVSFDHWFASVPSCTDPNRYFFLAGTSDGNVNPEPSSAKNNFTSPTFFDALALKNVPFKCYYGDWAYAFTYSRSAAKFLTYGRKMKHFYRDVKNNTLPAFSLIEPSFYIKPNDMHPAGDVRSGDNLVASIYNALRAQEQIWPKCVFIIMFDESGGFYSSLTPPSAVPPSPPSSPSSPSFPFSSSSSSSSSSSFSSSINESAKFNTDYEFSAEQEHEFLCEYNAKEKQKEKEEKGEKENENCDYAFDQYGPRVPALLISPWADHQLDHEIYDHTSVIRFLINKYDLDESMFGERVRKARDFASCLNRTSARTDCVEALPFLPEHQTSVFKYLRYTIATLVIEASVQSKQTWTRFKQRVKRLRK